ncbi:hypothetical protein [Nocardioides halotolerans]|uniref:hypothetical protein n=1 Tax=Nocardioides halotolerans TaxID=433660 RepID=UPI0012FAC583|nr:hypothetical protein [Nocardioides halotolerans]
MDLAEELTLKFGPPNGDGCFLVGVVDVLPETSEGIAHGRTAMCMRSVVRRLGFGRVPDDEVRHDEHGASVELLPRVRIAVTRSVILDGPESIGTPRLPTSVDQAAWLDSHPPADRDEQTDRAWWAAGFPRAEEDQWRELVPRVAKEHHDTGMTEQEILDIAIPWKVAGFSPSEAEEWWGLLGESLSGPDLAHSARDWRDRGFTAQEAAPWSGSWPGPAESPEGAQMFRDLGWHPFDVWLLNEFIDRETNPDFEHARRVFAKMDPGDAMDMARAGMTPGDGWDEFTETDGHDWRQELRNSYAKRTPIDPVVAMHINHHVWLGYGTEPPDDVPFRHERLWDLHDQANESAQREGRSQPYGLPRTVKPTGTAAGVGPTPGRDVCPGSGGPVVLLDRSDYGGWCVRCPECATIFDGHPLERLDEHVRPSTHETATSEDDL